MGDDKNEKCDSPLKSSKDLLLSEYNTVAEHVLEVLEESNMLDREKMNIFLQSKKKSEPLERVKKLISSFDENPEASILEASEDDKDAIDVVMEIGKNTSDSVIDAWFMLNQSKQEVSECSDDECGRYTPIEKPRLMLNLDMNFSDTTDDECEETISFPTKTKKISDFVKNGSSDLSDDESEQNISVSMGKKNSSFLQDNSSDFPGTECEQNVPICTEKEKLVSEDKSSELSNDEILQDISVPTERKRKLISVIEDEFSDISDGKCPQKISSEKKKKKCYK